MRNRFRDLKRMTKLMIIAPLAILAMVIFVFFGGETVMLLWNWLAPALFGLKQVTFWQGLGLLALCRILFGGFGMSGGASRRSRRQMFERWEQMTPEERERFRQRLYGRAGRTSPLDSNQTA
jgi:hypothetical protein